MKYFAVRRAIRIGGKEYIPCVCYKMTNALIPVIMDLVAKEKAIMSDEYLAFQNGKLLRNVPVRPRMVRPLAPAPKAEEPKVAEPVAEPVAEEPKVAEPVTDDSNAEFEPVTEEPATEEPIVKITKKSSKKSTE